MCDFTHSSVTSTAEHSHVYGKGRREGGSNPLIYSTSDPVCHLAGSRFLSQTHKHTYLSVPYLLPPPRTHLHPLLHPHSGSSCHHLSSSATQRNQFRPLLHTVMACWPREMESFQVLGLRLPSLLTPPLPPRCFSTFPQHAWCISRVARQHDRTAPESLLELFGTLCDLLKFLQNCMCVCAFHDSTLSLQRRGYTVRLVRVSETNEACIMRLNRLIVRFTSNRLSLMAKPNTHRPPMAS